MLREVRRYLGSVDTSDRSIGGLTIDGRREALKIVGPALDRLLVAGSWCKGAEAQDAKGKAVGARDKRAKSFCLMGVIRSVYAEAMSKPSKARVHVNSYEFAIDALFDMLEHVRPWSPSADARTRMFILEDWNDDSWTTYEDVLNLLLLTKEALHE